MYVSYSWLKDYIEINLSPEELAERLTMVGLEVGALTYFAPLDGRFVAGRIEALSKHPASPNLQIVKVNIGKESLEVVCGADNIRSGDMVPVAVPDTPLPDGRIIRPAEVKGVFSPGMLCSAGELGLEITEAKAGIMLLDMQCSPGERIIDLLPFNEPVLDVDLTPNRGDCLGMLGIAREVAAITGKRIVLPAAEVVESGELIEKLAGAEILEPELCYRYTARIMEGITIKPSPLKMQMRLLAVGIRSISNLVDVTNYVMWEAGFPMHAFDYDSLFDGRIIVRRALQGEELVTLDGIRRVLDPETLVIADSRVPVGLAGVMGGKDTEITAQTNRLFLEGASFNPLSIRMTARKMNLPSEASQRYEKGVDAEIAVYAQNRAVSLMRETAGGVIMQGIIDQYPSPRRQSVITLRYSRVGALLGYNLPPERIKDIFEGLSLTVEQGESAGIGTQLSPTAASGETIFRVGVPSYRRDLELEVDLIEELARIHGLDKVPDTLPSGVLTSGRPNRSRRLISKIRDILISCGLQEVITFSFINPKFFTVLQLPPDDPRSNPVKLQNPLTEDHSVLRTTLIPGLMQVLQYNFNRQIQDQFVFEIGKSFFPGEKDKTLPWEKESLALMLSGKKPLGDWQNPAREINFYEIKGIMDTMLQSLGIQDFHWEEAELPMLLSGQSGRLFVKDREVGFAGLLHPTLQERFDFNQKVLLGELSLDLILEESSLTPAFRSPPRFPAVFRDIAFIVKRRFNADDLLKTIRSYGGELLEEVTLFDVYEGKQIPADSRSLAFALTFRHSGKTLTDEEIDPVIEGIAAELQKQFQASLRQE